MLKGGKSRDEKSAQKQKVNELEKKVFFLNWLNFLSGKEKKRKVGKGREGIGFVSNTRIELCDFPTL